MPGTLLCLGIIPNYLVKQGPYPSTTQEIMNSMAFGLAGMKLLKANVTTAMLSRKS